MKFIPHLIVVTDMALNIKQSAGVAKGWVVSHRKSSIALAIALLLIGYWGYGKFTSTAGETRYVVATVAKETLISSVSGSGQVAAINQVDVKAKNAGDVVYVGVKSGDVVKKGTLLAQLNASDAQKAVRDAQVSLDSAKLALEKLQKPADELSLTQSQNTLARAEENKLNAQNNLIKAYDDGLNGVSNAFLDLPTVMAGLQDVLFTISPASTGADGTQQNIDFYQSAAERWDETGSQQLRLDAYNKYQAARTSYDKAFLDYKTLDRNSSKEAIEGIITETYQTTKQIADAIKSSNNLIQFYKDKLTEHSIKTAALADTHLTLLSGYTGKTNTHLANLLGFSTTIQGDKDAIVNAIRTIDENTKSLSKLKSGSDPLDLESSRLTVVQRQNALYDAQEKLADYFLRAPFDGTVAKVNVKLGDSLSVNTAAATVITPQQIATLTLNEVDAAKVKVGQKATMTFDAIEDLTITGSVSEVDTVGTVTQGVVSYTIKIAFDTQDDRVKPGMTVSAAIITNVKQDILSIPSSAIKTQGVGSYVEMFDTPLVVPEGAQNSQGTASTLAPKRQVVELGISNDTNTEITSGLKEGDQIIVRTISAAAQTTTAAPSLFGSLGGNNRGSGVRTVAP